MNIINLVKRFTSKRGKKRQASTTKSSVFKGDKPSWDEVWMSMAETIAQRSYDPRHRVGAVIVSDDNAQVLALGYNGNYSGGPNEAESNEPGQSGMIHAEINALLKLNYNNPKRKVMYLTLSPCRQCAKCIINAGIDEVVYRDEYRDTSGFELLRKSGLTLKKFTPDPR
jgi:dCMP deaminase